jgi:uncharacterized protein (DUF1697 family)
MTRYALLLRGVNVGTKNSLPMAELRAMLTKVGCTDVQTYVQSGNAGFGTKLAEAALTGSPSCSRSSAGRSTPGIRTARDAARWRPRSASFPYVGAVTTRNWNTVHKLRAMLDG